MRPSTRSPSAVATADTVTCATHLLGLQDVLGETLLQLQAFVPKPGDMCCCLSFVASVDQHISTRALLPLHSYLKANVYFAYCPNVGMMCCQVLVYLHGWLLGMVEGLLH